MKQLTCEMCGSNDLVKQDGVFVCQSCGCKYSVEEAKKMMVEGTVEVTGTVKVDDTARTENYLILAKNACDSKNYLEAENYCNKVIEIEPSNYDAWMFKGYATGWQSTFSNLRIEEAINCFTQGIINAPDEFKESINERVYDDASNLFEAIASLCYKTFIEISSEDVADKIVEHMEKIDYCISLLHPNLQAEYKSALIEVKQGIALTIAEAATKAWREKSSYRYTKTAPGVKPYVRTDDPSGLIECANSSITLFWKAFEWFEEYDEGATDSMILCLKEIISINDDLIHAMHYPIYINGNISQDHVLTVDSKKIRVDKMMRIHSMIKNLDPSYHIPERPTVHGCYIATCIYSSYDCPQVWTLRRFRDNTLAKTMSGRAFIRTYYAISPTLVKWFGHTSWFKKIWKGTLDRVVSKLQANGVEDTPYQDRNW